MIKKKIKADDFCPSKFVIIQAKIISNRLLQYSFFVTSF